MAIGMARLMMAGLLVAPAVGICQTPYDLQFAEDTIGSGSIAVNSAGVVTSVSNIALNNLTVQGGSNCPPFCEPPVYNIDSGVLDISGKTLSLYGDLQGSGSSAVVLLLTAQFATPLLAQSISGPGPDLYLQFPAVTSFSVNSSLLSDLGIAGGMADPFLSGSIFATETSKGKYQGFDGETDLSFDSTPVKAPEIDLGAAMSAATLLAGGLLALGARGRLRT